MLTRPIPASGEELPVIGLGTYIIFDVESTPANIDARQAIVKSMIEKGASLIDSSPMYNRAEDVVGDIIKTSRNRDKLFLATKVWTNGKAAGERQMRASSERMNAGVMDLMQVHNLRDTDEHLATIRDWQAEGRIRYNGVTHYRAGALDDLEAAMRQHKPEFIQINYSLTERESDQRILPLAKDLGIAVLINRPFVAGRLFRAVRDRPVPDWAREFAESWGQFFLKFIISHPAVTCVIPATSKIHHMADNLGAGFGSLPDDKTRQRMANYFASL
ncbi:MAG: aldo/keto reductase [Proteobacteria bacterium]|nr:aldo/keto reductase [Pseudomonadota bacterium]